MIHVASAVRLLRLLLMSMHPLPTISEVDLHDCNLEFVVDGWLTFGENEFCDERARMDSFGNLILSLPPHCMRNYLILNATNDINL